MSNRFFNFVNALISGSVAKSSEVNDGFQGADVGFSAVEAELNTAIKFPANESTTNQRITQAPSQRHAYMLGFDAAGSLAVTNAFLGNWDMGGFRMYGTLSPVASDEPVTLGYLNSFAGSLAGLPSITAQNGPLVTDGATVSWDTTSRLVPVVTSISPSSQLVYSGGTVRWMLRPSNAAFDPNGVLGTAYWSTTLDRVSDISGPHFSTIVGLTTATFDHKPTATTGEIPCGATVAIVSAVTVDTLGTSAGTISLVHRYYDAAHALISESAGTSITMGSASTRYSIATTTPALTAYVVAVLVFTGVTASSYGVNVSNLKTEPGTVPSPFDDYKTLALAYGATATTYFGAGSATVVVQLGDTNSTTSALNLRSTTGTQAYDTRILSTGGTNGTVGLGAMTVTAKSVAFSGIIGHASEYNAGNSGAAITINFATNGPYQKVTLSAATPAITVATAGLVVGKYQLKVVQDATGSRLPTWVGFVAGDCVGNTFPTVAASAAGVTFVQLYWDGTQFWVSSNAWDA